MEKAFYESDTERVHVSITATLNNGELSLDGYDYGKYVEEFRGTDDFEYSLYLNLENTNKLFECLDVLNKTDKEKLEAVRDMFCPSKGVFGLYEYCKANNIATSYFSS